jgi:hypothetical protein
MIQGFRANGGDGDALSINASYCQPDLIDALVTDRH